MEKTLTRESTVISQSTSHNQTDYRDGVWKFLEKEVVEILSEEIKKASQEILEEQKCNKQLRRTQDGHRGDPQGRKESGSGQTHEWRKQILNIVPDSCTSEIASVRHRENIIDS
jgi:hypothetical protein